MNLENNAVAVNSHQVEVNEVVYCCTGSSRLGRCYRWLWLRTRSIYKRELLSSVTTKLHTCETRLEPPKLRNSLTLLVLLLDCEEIAFAGRYCRATRHRQVTGPAKFVVFSARIVHQLKQFAFRRFVVKAQRRGVPLNPRSSKFVTRFTRKITFSRFEIPVVRISTTLISSHRLRYPFDSKTVNAARATDTNKA